jgi:Flp pilus assembly CpaF family ATPase
MSENFDSLEWKVFKSLSGKLGSVHTDAEIYAYIEAAVKSIDPTADKDKVDAIFAHSQKFDPVDGYIRDPEIEDIMINNTENIFVYHASDGSKKAPERLNSVEQLDTLVSKLNMYSTSNVANGHIYDVHLPNGSRCNVVDTPMGPAITIRNHKPIAYSIIDLINFGELSYNLAARFWLYSEGLGIEPANMLLGGLPGSGKTTLLNAMFSFYRPEERIIVIEETYEINTKTQENCINLETSPDMSLQDLLSNALRMRPDIIIIGEVRGVEAKDMMAAMSIGKSVMSTLHAYSTRDIIKRMEHDPMRIPQDMISLVDALVVVSQVQKAGKKHRTVTQVSEISGMETQVLLSDLYNYDYKTQKSSEMLPSVTYRDTLAKASGHSPTEIIMEEERRAKILERLNKTGIRDLRSINEFCRDYYDNPAKALARINSADLGTLD